MNTVPDEKQKLVSKLGEISPEDLAKVGELVETGEIPEADRADFAAFQAQKELEEIYKALTPEERADWLQQAQAITGKIVRTCPHCGKVFEAQNGRRLWHSNACKQAAYRARKARGVR